MHPTRPPHISDWVLWPSAMLSKKLYPSAEICMALPELAWKSHAMFSAHIKIINRAAEPCSGRNVPTTAPRRCAGFRVQMHCSDVSLLA